MGEPNSQHFYDQMRKKHGKPTFDRICDSQQEAVREINARTAQLKLGGKVVYPDLTAWPLQCYSKSDMADILVDFDVLDWSAEKVPAFRWWLAQPDRRVLEGVVFEPHPVKAARLRDTHLNLFRGFAMKPAAGAGSYEKFSHHLRMNVCDNNVMWENYILDWMSHLIQFPGEKIGVAPVLVGDKGCGKTTVAQVLSRLIGESYCPVVDNPTHLTGRFTRHLTYALLVCVEEAFFARDKQNEARLKSMITSSRLMCESKHMDAEEMPSRANYIFTSNSEHVVPASRDERRFFVLRVGNGALQDRAFFKSMWEELEAGGLAAFMADLMTRDLTSFKLARAPMTAALAEQVRAGLNDLDRWWADALARGALPFVSYPHGEAVEDFVWPECSPWEVDAAHVYASAAQAGGRHSPPGSIVVGRFLATACPGAVKSKRSDRAARVPTFRLPCLHDARAAFDKARPGLGLAECWPADHPSDLPAPANDLADAA